MLDEVKYSDFSKMDLRIGKIVDVEEPEGSKNILKITVDFGTEKRIAMAGLKGYYSPEDLIGKKFLFILNLERKKIMGVESECMILAADDENGNVVLIEPEKDIEAGSKIR